MGFDSFLSGKAAADIKSAAALLFFILKPCL